MIYPTPTSRLEDQCGRLLWFKGVEELETWSLDRLLEELRQDSDEGRSLALGSLMRCARPDDVFRWVEVPQIIADWRGARRYAGDRQPLWNLIVSSLIGCYGPQ